MTANAAKETEDVDYPVAIGEVISDRFRVDRFIGIGAMGLVVEATHLELNERVAIKFLRDSAKSQADAAIRFAREARAVARLKSEHVVRVFDVGETAKGTPYIVMEYLVGMNLDDILVKDGRLDVSRAVHLTIQLCEALAEAHSLGIVHRDIKPANVFIIDRGASLPDAKLLDFGISKSSLTGEYADTKLDTQTSAIMGSPYYMAPEQVRSTKDVDARADIWAVGTVLFELITGHPVWRSTDLGKLVPEILSSDPRRLREVKPDLDAKLEAVIATALEPEVDRRYRSAADFAKALLPFGPQSDRLYVDRAMSFKQLAGSTGALPALRQSSRDLSVGRPNRVSTTSLAAPPPRSTTPIAIATAAAAIIGIVMLVVPRLRSGPPPATPASTTATAPVVPIAPPSNVAPAPVAVEPSTPTAVAPSSLPVVKGTPPVGAGVFGRPSPISSRPLIRPGAGTHATASAPAATSATSAAATAEPKAADQGTGLESNPWRNTQPKLEDNPFK